jgi:hypothetical protein
VAEALIHQQTDRLIGAPDDIAAPDLTGDPIGFELDLKAANRSPMTVSCRMAHAASRLPRPWTRPLRLGGRSGLGRVEIQ